MPDRELLRALFVQQLGLAPAGEVMSAGAEWLLSREKGESLCDVLQRRGVLDGERRQLVESLVDEAIAASGGDPRSTLEGLPTPMRESLDGLSASLGTRADVTLPGDGPPASLGGGTSVSFDSLETPENVGVEAKGRYAFDPGPDGRPEELGKGGVGLVLLARDHFLHRQVAFKVLRRDITTNPQYDTLRVRTLEARFLREARVTAQLEHPSIVRVYELGRRRDGTLYYTMQRVRGRTLGQAVAAAGALEHRLEFVPDVLAAAQAIASAHHRHVIHRDLKPQNIMLGAHGETYVMDWGLARVVGRPERIARPLQLAPDLTAGHDLGPVGTPSYMSPEQAKGQTVDERSDVWGLGAILFEVLTGRAPFVGRSPWDVLAEVSTAEPPRVRSLEREAPAELVAICEKALQRDSARRYANATELAEDLARYLQGRRVSAYGYTTHDVVRRLISRHRAIAALISAGVVLLLGAAVGGGVVVRRERDEAREMARFFLRDVAPTLKSAPGAAELTDQLSVSALESFARDLDLQRGPLDDRLLLTRAWNEAAAIAWGQGRSERASQAVASAQLVIEPLRQQFPTDVAVTVEWARTRTVAVDLLLDEGKEAEALAELAGLLETCATLAKTAPDDPPALQTRALVLNRAASVHANHGELEVALEHYRQAVAVTEHWNTLVGDEESAAQLVSALSDLGLAESFSSTAQAAAEFRRGVSVATRVLAARESSRLALSLAEAQLRLGQTQLAVDAVAARENLRAAEALLVGRLRVTPEDAFTQATLVDTKVLLGSGAEAWAEAQHLDKRGEYGDSIVAAAFASGHEAELVAMVGLGDDPTHDAARAMGAVVLSLQGRAADAAVMLEPCLKTRCWERVIWSGPLIAARAAAAGARGASVGRLAAALPGALPTRPAAEAAWSAFAAELGAGRP